MLPPGNSAWAYTATKAPKLLISAAMKGPKENKFPTESD